MDLIAVVVGVVNATDETLRDGAIWLMIMMVRGTILVVWILGRDRRGMRRSSVLRWCAGSVRFWVAMVLQFNIAAFAGGSGPTEAVAVGGDAGEDEEEEVDDTVSIALANVRSSLQVFRLIRAAESGSSRKGS